MGIHRHETQRGYALLLMVLLLMGAGGIALAGFTQQARQEAEEQRYEHNKRVLREAKQALLMFAYNYPQTNPGQGPGRLPCPDHDNDGLIGFPPDCSLVGRFPWRDDRLNVASNVVTDPPYHFRDASGETLWYAVSSAFGNATAGVVNSSTTGQMITLKDKSGAILYDGTAAGIAAVIIAPGPIVGRDEDNDVNSTYEIPQLRNIAAQQIDPSNYLDTYNGIDNSVFASDSIADADSFILGPIVENDPSSPQFGTVVVNDQMIIVTADEVIAMAEKAVLQAYKDAINEYRGNLGDDAYPWLDDYTTTDLTRYDGDVGTRLGRVPSMFAEYFNTNAVDGQPIISDLVIETSIDGFNSIETVPAADVYFKTDGNLVTSFVAPYTITRYYWDGHDTNAPSSPADGIWEICEVVTGTEEDCNQDGANNFIGGTSSVDWMKVRLVTITLSNGVPGDPFEFPYSDRTWPGVPLVFTDPTGASHARVKGRYNNNSLYLTATWTQDDDFQDSFTEMPAGNNGTLVFDGGDTLDLSLVYYPVLPVWALAAEDDWHDAVQFGFAAGYAPGGGATCTVGTDCITVENTGGVNNDKIAVITLAADDPALFIDEDGLGFDNDLADIFDPENAHEHDETIPGSGDDDPAPDGILDQDVFAVRAGNDSLLVIR